MLRKSQMTDLLAILAEGAIFESVGNKSRFYNGYTLCGIRMCEAAGIPADIVNYTLDTAEDWAAMGCPGKAYGHCLPRCSACKDATRAIARSAVERYYNHKKMGWYK